MSDTLTSPNTALVHVRGPGRPPDHDRAELLAKVKAVADLIGLGLTKRDACEQVGLGFQTYARAITSDPQMWVLHAQGRIEQAHTLADEMLDVARSRPDNMVDAQQARTHVDVLKWRCAKLHPRTYGDAAKLELTGLGGGPVQVQAWTVAGKLITF